MYLEYLEYLYVCVKCCIYEAPWKSELIVSRGIIKL